MARRDDDGAEAGTAAASAEVAPAGGPATAEPPRAGAGPAALAEPGPAALAEPGPAAPAPDASPAPGPAAAGPSTRRVRRRRLAALAAVLAAAAGAVVAVRVASAPRGPGSPSGAAAPAPPRAAIEAPAGPALPPGPAGLRLSGLVIDGAGAPVLGAEVSAEPERGAVEPALATAGSAGSAGSGSAGSGSAAAVAVAVAPPSGPDGRFAITGLGAGRYRLRVTGPGLVAAELRFVPVPSDEVRILVARQVRIEGAVTDGGDPVQGAVVGLRGEAIGGELTTATDALGAFAFPELPEGRYQVYAWKGPLAARAVRLSRLGAGPFPAVELRLELGAIVVGRVIDRDEGTGLAAAVELRPSGDDQAPRFARSGEDGLFRIEGVPAGRWIADAYAPGYVGAGAVELDAGRGVPELALARGAAIEGRVLDGDGRPIEGASVRALLGEGASAQEVSAGVEQDRLRRYSGRMVAPAPLAASSWRAADPTFLPRGELGVTVGPIPPIPPPGTQVARAASVDPTAAAAAVAPEPAPLPVEAGRAAIWVTGADGRFRIPGLARGTAAALAVAAGLAEGRSRAVAVALGQVITGVDVVLTPGVLIVGRVTSQRGDPVIGAQVSAAPAQGAPLTAFTAADGTFELGPVAGAIELAAVAFGHAEVRRRIALPLSRGRQPSTHREDLVLQVADGSLAALLEDTGGAAVAGAQIEVIGPATDGRFAVSAADGTFAIDLLPPGPVRVRVRHAAYPLAELAATATAGPRVTARLKIPLGGAVEGVLLDDFTAAPLAGVVITATGPAGRQAEATTGTGGKWTLGPVAAGAWRLAVATPGYLPLARELDVPAARAPGAPTVRDVRLELRRGALVGGTVRDARGQRLAGARVTIQEAGGVGPLAEGVTDAQGEFRVRDAPPGDVVVSAARGDARGAIRVTVRAGAELLGLAIDVR
jgi:hypothetical protein